MSRAGAPDEQERDWFIEQVGIACEADGFTHIAGRVFGLLLLSSEPCSLDDMAEILDVSKASVSTEARRLLERDVVVRHAIEGDRRDYYEISPDFFRALMQQRVARWSRMHELAVAARERMPHLPLTVLDRLAYVDTVHDFLLERVQSAISQWNERVNILAPSHTKKAAGRRPTRRAAPE